MNPEPATQEFVRALIAEHDAAGHHHDGDRLEGLRELADARMFAIEQATRVAKESMEKRLESMNEFRDTLRDQSRTFITRSEHETLIKEIQSLRESRAELAGKASQSSVHIAWAMGAAGILLSVIGIVEKFLK